ncbi:MAG TPA: GAF and ANTAR domain-containing protein [Jatrophihabitans sp.]|nr:GAF and ANTAR domain-containing protein [Jatrophihabitans sp.]
MTRATTRATDPARPSDIDPREFGLDFAFDLDDLAALLRVGVGLLETLTRIAEYAVRASKQVDGSVVRLVDDRLAVAAGLPAARLADDLQYVLHEGPALDALAARSVTRASSLGGDVRWRRFGPRVGRMGLHSVLVVPLALLRDPVGTISLYSAAKHAFSERDERRAHWYAAPAAAVVRNAVILEQSRRQVDQLTEALQVRPVIDQAVGILMARTGKSADEALRGLRRTSNIRRVKLAEIAQEIVDEAVRRSWRQHN